jgi:putative serine protease PepD
MPDFSFGGPGVRLKEVLPGSPAEQAGIRAGDIVTAMDGESVTDLRSYSRLLKAHGPGDEVEITFLRDGEETVVRAILVER